MTNISSKPAITQAEWIANRDALAALLPKLSATPRMVLHSNLDELMEYEYGRQPAPESAP